MSTGLSMLLFVSLTIALLWTAECQTPITCTAGYYKPGEKATITCHFHGEVSTDQNTGVYITWFDLHAPKDSSGKEVLMCHFSGGAVSVCKPEDGYRFVSFKNNLTIEVPDVSAEFQGRYSCGVVPANGRTAHPCFLLVEGAFAQPEDAPPEKPETNEKLHKHVETTHTLVIITFLIIIIIVAAAAIMFVTLAYKKNWFPFRKDAVKPNKNEQNAMLEKGEPGRSGTLTDGSRRITQETTMNPTFNNSSDTPSPSGELDKPLLTKEDTEPRDSRSGREDDQKEDDAAEKNVETNKEREAREKTEKVDKKAEEKRQEQARKDELKVKLKNAGTKEDKRLIQKAFDDEEKRLKMQKDDEEKRLKRQKDDEEKRLKRQKDDEEKRLKRQKEDEKKARKNSKKDKK